jgi:pyridoxamine 5'-phosphate oxidase
MSTLPSPTPEDPVPVVSIWLAEIVSSGHGKNPNAMALATSNRAGAPSLRMVLLKEIAPAGYAVFYSNYQSRKGTELDENPRAAAMLYWEPLGRQVRFEGPVVRSPAAESDAYFATRPALSQLNAWSSAQSRPLASQADLERAAARIGRELGIEHDGAAATRAVPRPAHWGGYRLWFETVELWVEGANRFHERLQYRRELEPADTHTYRAGPWSKQRLQP